MSRFVNLSIMIIAAIFVTRLAGIPSGADDALTWFGLASSPGIGSISFSTFLLALGAIYLTAAGAGIVIGFLTKSSFEWAVIAGAIANIAVLYGSIDGIINATSSLPVWISYGIYTIFGLLGVFYVFSAFEFTFNR